MCKEFDVIKSLTDKSMNTTLNKIHNLKSIISKRLELQEYKLKLIEEFNTNQFAGEHEDVIKAKVYIMLSNMNDTARLLSELGYRNITEYKNSSKERKLNSSDIRGFIYNIKKYDTISEELKEKVLYANLQATTQAKPYSGY